jgi:hypothetical protein
MTTKFIPQIASNNTIKLFEAQTGQLHRIINVSGTIISQPICLENEMYVSVDDNGVKKILFFSLPYGGLSRIQNF